ncbi:MULTISPECIES: hypothetical protein [unclassified Acinetobacter]|uniref:hypothetical protein n=1 Tax=unclassified Acinetobacter TaxID=196816 RepID=UPI0024478CF8|nr:MULTISPECIES: hypothetical protein [unclassified Acinetobacter]MDH0032004.1 hypothetical protein [Acinetobacter sp. GD04021]MDH0887660.1 hypothetical protein [Acinetobacter sp. GD03873]MDH1084008.1 hypothetical protein [Acinetobacter sp. GD03983]MDH2191065.1 hypothetical protein [Acinetobacter sp. GD03645]MDH2204520.1 hypothetical protein [Acinetobacter sp. GD03647]
MNRLYIILGIVVLIMIGVVWKSNGDRKAREEAFAQQTEQHKQEMAQLEAENQARLAQEAKDKVQKEQSRIEYNAQTNVVTKEGMSPQKQNKYSNEEWLSICKSVSGTAKSIMSSRQKGASMSDMMSNIMSVDIAPELKEIIKPFVVAAYEEPRYSTSDYQLKAEIDFENKAYLTCIKARE